MNAYVSSSPQEKVISGAGALGMHLVFIALLIFGVNWQKKVEPQANVVDLWKDLPTQAQPRVEPPPVPPPVQPVAPPKVEPPPPPKPVAKPEVAKPDIAMKEKAEKEKAEKEKAEKDRRLLEDQKKEAKKRELDKQQQAAKEAALAKEQDDVQRKLTEQAATAQTKLIDDYKARIQARIYQAMQPFDDLPKDTFAEVEITVLPDGNVLATVIKKNSASPTFNAAVERAILRSQPLPVPKDAALFANYFRRLELTFRPKQ